MNRSEEDALILQVAQGLYRYFNEADIERLRLAIRAAVAHERERAAKNCEAIAADVRPSPEWRDKRPEEAMIDDARADVANSCAAAIRRGTE